ncbi:c-type cytochrome [Aliibacillus thermotolerans]|uniref:C-type cytochrome n=1 Tax=Aliibacillus thermotolerans TaxID=1834418 RepID=A0ABW0U4A2_9BACI|nr:menaquinol-cytochrome c reductase cytochrome b/c subunit [Aliibacillus thermotolerans]MDA3130178.1 cytochrome C oxidase Cbb3 [Aliibacillus thermotolerans]
MQRGKGMKFVGDSRVPASGRKPNIPKDYSEYPGKTEAFFPNFLLKEWLVGAVFLVGYLCLTAAHPSPLERLADPTDSGYIPLPDWYFLFLYQLLKYEFVSGDYVVIGIVIIPALSFGALLLAPWLDRGPERRASRRPIASGMMLLAVLAVVYLTWEAVENHDWEAAAEQGEMLDDEAAELAEQVDTEHEGYQIYSDQGCIACHGDQLQGSGAAGPSLFDTQYDVDTIKNIAVEGIGEMPPGLFEGTDEELQILAEYIASGGGAQEGESGEDGASAEDAAGEETTEESDEE